MSEPASSEPAAVSSFTVTKSGIHHFGCVPGGMHHEDDCLRGMKMDFSQAVPITFDAVPDSGLSVYGLDIADVDGDPPQRFATVFWTEGL